ncbi:hypothetical protein PWEIH_10438 [Listeria weihenstephanensis FSL R9-0317]|nr:hypothetical protein PWEIH_10438 [Listeria weihenstephanensis FSL R9-0317]
MDEKSTRSSVAENILTQIDNETKLGDLKKIAKDIKKRPRVSYGTLVNRSVSPQTISSSNYGQKIAYTGLFK